MNGIDLEVLPPDTSAMERIVQPVAARYRFPEQARVEELNISENATYRVEDPTDGRAGILRIHRNGYHTLQEVASELEWLSALREGAGIDAPVPMSTRTGAEIVAVRSAPLPDERYCVMFEELAGRAPDDERLVECCAALGAITARMHLHGDAWTAPGWFTRPTWDFDTIVGSMPRWGFWEQFPSLGPSERRLLSAAQGEIGRRLEALGTGPEGFGLIHADIRLGNTIDDGDRLWLIDFDDCGFGWYLWDLATIFTFIEDRPAVPEAIERWLRGYGEVRKVPPASRSAVPAFLMLRRLQVMAWLAWHSETELAKAEGPGYLDVTLALAERFLDDPTRGADWV